MYKSFFKLDRKPFETLPDNSFLWLGENHKEALSTLRYGILDNKGFLLLTGDAGVGKTSLIKALTKSFDSDVLWAVVEDPTLDRIDFYNEIARNFGIDKKFTSKVQFLIQFSHFLHKADDDNKKVLLLVDECHQLSQEMLEELRLLSNIEKADAKLINIFFVGESSFNDLLGQPKNRAVRQRLTLTAQIPRLTVEETEDYIRHRMDAAGAEDTIFSAKACRLVQRYSDGLPLEIHRICDAALKLGAKENEYTVTPALIERALNKTDIVQDTGAIPIQDEGVDEPSALNRDFSKFQLGDSPDSQITGFNLEADRKPGWLKFGLATLALIVLGVYLFKPEVPPVAEIEPPPQLEEKAAAELPEVKSLVPGSPAVAVLEEKGDEINRAKADELKSAILEKAYNDEPLSQVETIAEETSPSVEEPSETVVVTDEGEKDELTAPLQEEDKEAHAAIEKAATVVAPPVEVVVVVPSPVEEIVAEPAPAPEPIVKMERLEPRKVLLPLQPNSLKLTRAGTRAFENFVEKLLEYPKATLLIKGFVSSKSNSPENIKLSENRALAVYKMMLKKGVDPEQIEMEGMGNQEPIASNDTRAGRTKNRRVEIVVIRDGLEEI